MAEWRVGTSGYLYRDWRGPVYPRGLPTSAWLGHYAARFSTVELNATFYGLPRRDVVRRWHDAVPDDFRFALKLSRYGTHVKRLREPEEWLQRFFEAVEPLRERIGVILAQLPPRWSVDRDRLAAFLEAFPPEPRLAIEFRDASWFDPAVYALLRRHGVALCEHDVVARHPRVVTADHVYLRFHGPDPRRPYVGPYPGRTLVGAARRIRRHVVEGRDVHAYFNNDQGAQAVRDAERLMAYLAAVRSGPARASRAVGWSRERSPGTPPSPDGARG